MGEWVVTVAGIAILSVLCDVILHEGQTKKYIKTVFGVVITLVIVQPLIGLFTGEIDLNFADKSTGVQQQYLDSVTSRQNEIAVGYITQTLNEKGIEVVHITVSELEQRVTAQLNIAYNAQIETTVKDTIGAYFGNYDIVTIWK